MTSAFGRRMNQRISLAVQIGTAPDLVRNNPTIARTVAAKQWPLLQPASLSGNLGPIIYINGIPLSGKKLYRAMKTQANPPRHFSAPQQRGPGWSARAVWCNRDGAAAVEFAIVSAVLLPMLFGLIAFSSQFFAMNAMQTGAAEAARRMAVSEAGYALGNTACSAATTAGTTQYIACRLMPSWGTYTVNIALDCASRDVTVRMTNNSSIALGDVYRFITGTNFSTTAITRWEKTACP